jgi:hypothetical protein
MGIISVINKEKKNKSWWVCPVTMTGEEVTGKCRKLHTGELHNLHSLPNIIISSQGGFCLLHWLQLCFCFRFADLKEYPFNIEF